MSLWQTLLPVAENLDLASFVSGLESLVKINPSFKPALTAVQAAQIEGTIETIADAAQIAARFYPPAIFVEDAAILALVATQAYMAGLWRPAEPGDPWMDRVDGGREGR